MKEEDSCNINWVEKRTWEEFRMTGLLWWINGFLNMFGWAICCDVDDEENVINAYPTRTKYRGFSTDLNDEGYQKVTKYMRDNAVELYDETTM